MRLYEQYNYDEGGYLIVKDTPYTGECDTVLDPLGVWYAGVNEDFSKVSEEFERFTRKDGALWMLDQILSPDAAFLEVVIAWAKLHKWEIEHGEMEVGK